MISQGEADALLVEDLTGAQRTVERLVKVPLTDAQYGALVSFVFNVGAGAFAKSTMLRLINEHDCQLAALEFGRWVKANGETLPGLVKRRADEKALFYGGFDLG
jgi:lysozyme